MSEDLSGNMRGIVDGEPPVDNLPVFEMIELAEAWKKRL